MLNDTPLRSGILILASLARSEEFETHKTVERAKTRQKNEFVIGRSSSEGARNVHEIQDFASGSVKFSGQGMANIEVSRYGTERSDSPTLRKTRINQSRLSFSA